ncbi:hypothetical protein [Ferroplasma acidiphilum]|uniref:hypothetical protein n=1 Tax=Ferroplasma acidiphilum TaxID=74969 RepID=UPI0023F395AF|nr:hypothetical protein [Ferroplasma acidiphilum]
MTEFRTRKNGKAYPLRNNRVVQKATQKATQISQAQLKKIHIHGLSLAGYAVDLADSLRKKALVKAVNKYGKSDTMAELSLLRDRYAGNERMERVIDSDIAYIAKGKFEEE